MTAGLGEWDDEPLAAGEETPNFAGEAPEEEQAATPAPYYPTVEAFVRELLAPTYRRSLGGHGVAWCPYWWRHAEGIARLERSGAPGSTCDWTPPPASQCGLGTIVTRTWLCCSAPMGRFAGAAPRRATSDVETRCRSSRRRKDCLTRGLRAPMPRSHDTGAFDDDAVAG